MPTKGNSNCQSCLMPFSKDTGTRESELYCSLCYRDGKFQYEGDAKGFREAAYASMRARGIPVWKAKLFTFMTRFAPRWKKRAN